MTDDTERPLPEDSPLLWFALLAGPLAWSAHLLLSYALVPVTCETGWIVLLPLVTLVTALASLAGALVSRRLPGADAADSHDSLRANAASRTRFICQAGFASGLFFAAVIVVQTLPVLFLDPCSWG